MTYSAMVDMGKNSSLLARVSACAAEQGNVTPTAWATSNLPLIVTDSAWTAAWDYAKATATINWNPDLGIHDDVITDAMILSKVQALKTAQLGSQGWPAS